MTPPVSHSLLRHARTLALRCLAALLAATLSACVHGQVPATRPALVNAKLEDKLSGMLRFDVPLLSADSLAVYTIEGRAPEPLLLDVREVGEYAVSHLPGAVHVAPGKLPAWLDTVPHARPIVVYCTVGYRSERLGRELREAGFTEVQNLYGSIFEWVDRGYGLVDASGAPTRDVHTYNKRWGRWLTSPTATKVD